MTVPVSWWRVTTVYGRHRSAGSPPAATSARSRSSTAISALAISQYTSSQAAATSGVTASPSTSTMAANRCSWTILYCSLSMPTETCLWAIRASIASGRWSGWAISADAKAAIEPASAWRWVPLAWLPRLKRSRSSSGRAANIRS